MTWQGRVSALVLTYNRKDVLIRCLNAIMEQIEQPDEIIILDNGSLDGTCEFLLASGFQDDRRIALYRLPQNAGPAVGMHILFKLGMESGCEWLWYLDDDTIPDAHALRELKKAFANNFSHPEEVGYLKSIAVSADGSPNDIPEVDFRQKPGMAPTWADRLSSGLVKIRWATFNSILIPRTTVLRIGSPSFDFYFAGEDIDFTFRTTEVLPGYLVGRSKVVHLCAVSGAFDILL